MCTYVYFGTIQSHGADREGDEYALFTALIYDVLYMLDTYMILYTDSFGNSRTRCVLTPTRCS